MTVENIDTVIVGGGQAGLAMSEHLGQLGIEHLILERYRIAERWRSERWDSLVANGPAWHDRFPTLEFSDTEPGAFPGKERVADYFVEYAQVIKAPIRCGVEVTSAEKLPGQMGFRVETSQGAIEARNVVAATGPFQRPVIPPVIPEQTDVLQMHSNAYRNPENLPQGAILVVGAGSSGGQIADELLRAGRKVYLSVGPHDRPPRSYRGHDFVWWLGVLGKWDATALDPGTEHVTISVSGARGGHTVDFRQLAEKGMNLVGLTMSFEDSILHFADDLGDNIAHGDNNYLSVLDEADEWVERNGLDLPLEPEARLIGPDPECVTHPIRQLNLKQAGISTVIWATGYAVDYSWLKVDSFDERGNPIHQRGVSSESGVYFVGLPWQSRRGSSFIWGVWHDAKYVADQIAIQRSYITHHNSTQTS
ncbi:MAG: SidA/IucD/PvdA family monooxygenase [Rhizobiaceae bacterium]|nr:SidA/IucD/PvdA family monooxygenase [Rhizobiaceae bacterium]